MADPAPDDDVEGIPRWVWAFGLLIGVLVIGFLAMHLLGGGFPAHTLP
ncbi:MAG: hypothetical protein ACRDFR_05055 [Candidatus Limnocylindria bacterium]